MSRTGLKSFIFDINQGESILFGILFITGTKEDVYRKWDNVHYAAKKICSKKRPIQNSRM